MADSKDNRQEVKAEDNMPCCSVCEEDSKARAVKYCTTCCCLYCKDCLASCHPMRGALKRHRLISSQEYLSQGASEDQFSSGQPSSQQLLCVTHGQPFCSYCVPCQMVICLRCVVDHSEHSIQDIPSAAERDKSILWNQTGELVKVLKETKDSLSGFLRLYNKIQENQNLHIKEVEKAYNIALADINTRYSEWRVHCGAIIKRLQLQTDTVESMVQASEDLFTSNDVEFLQGSTDFTKTTDDQLTEIRAALDKHEVVRKKLSASVQRDLAVPIQLTVKETAQDGQDVEAAVYGQVTALSVTKPTLSFTKTHEGYLRITDEGAVMKTKDFSRFVSCAALTDGRWRAGSYYWELQITCSPCCDCRVGVVQESCGQTGNMNPGSDSWFILMAYSDGKVWCECHSGSEIKPDYRQWRPHKGPLHVGLYLNCYKRSLIILDCGENQVMATVRGLRVTQPLVPWVQLYCNQPASARLVTGDSATLPQVLCDILNIF